MKKLLLHLVFALLLFQLVLCIFFSMAKRGLVHYFKPSFEKCDLLFQDTRHQDLLFLGSSRTFYGIDPAVIERLTGKKALNAGFEGARINEMEMVLQGYLHTHSRPEKIFLMLDLHSLDLSHTGIYNKIFLSQYLDNEGLYRSFRKEAGIGATFWKYIPYSILAEFDDYTRGNCMKGLAGGTQLKNNVSHYKGYVSLLSAYHPETDHVSLAHATDAEGMKILRRIADTCSKLGILLQILQGPYLEDFYTKNQLALMYASIRRDLSSYPAVNTQSFALNYKDTACFKDQVHLNHAGAERYSRDLVSTFLEK